MAEAEFEGLIFDLGMSEGNDTAYYLAKGFKVLGVEADPGICEHLRQRFAFQISCGALTLLNNAVGRSYGEVIEIHSSTHHQGVSGIAKRPDIPDDYITHRVPTVDWRTLVAQAGPPRYLKIDVEGSEGPFLDGMLAQSRPDQLPEFMSVECYTLEHVERLHALGYRRFAMVDQNPPGGLKLPSRQFEGKSVQSANFSHCSGPFGLDVFVETGWSDLSAIRASWPSLSANFGRTWYDCHAWKPK